MITWISRMRGRCLTRTIMDWKTLKNASWNTWRCVSCALSVRMKLSPRTKMRYAAYAKASSYVSLVRPGWEKLRWDDRLHTRWDANLSASPWVGCGMKLRSAVTAVHISVPCRDEFCKLYGG